MIFWIASYESLDNGIIDEDEEEYADSRGKAREHISQLQRLQEKVRVVVIIFIIIFVTLFCYLDTVNFLRVPLHRG